MRTNYHTHVERCNQAKGSDEEYMLSAINGGYDLLGVQYHNTILRANFEDSSKGNHRKLRINQITEL